MDQAELDKSMKLLELVENDVIYVVASSYLPDSASTPVKGASNIGPCGLISHIRAQSINAKNVNCHMCSTHVRPPLHVLLFAKFYPHVFTYNPSLRRLCVPY